VFLGGVVRKLFSSRREETIEACRKLRNEALHDLHFYQGIKPKSVRMAGHVACVQSLSNQNFIHEEIMIRLKPLNACYHSV